MDLASDSSDPDLVHEKVGTNLCESLSSNHLHLVAQLSIHTVAWLGVGFKVQTVPIIHLSILNLEMIKFLNCCAPGELVDCVRDGLGRDPLPRQRRLQQQRLRYVLRRRRARSHHLQGLI